MPRCRSQSDGDRIGVELGIARVEREVHEEVVAGRVQLRQRQVAHDASS